MFKTHLQALSYANTVNLIVKLRRKIKKNNVYILISSKNSLHNNDNNSEKQFSLK